MADGGAWQSGVFDNGRDFQKTTAPPVTGAEGKSPVTGVPAAMYNPPASMASGRDGAHMPVISIALRCACILFSVVGTAIIASNSYYYAYDDETGYQYAWYRALNTSGMRYLLAMDVIVCAYSIVQLVLSIVKSCTGKPVLQGPTTSASTITFLCDQVLTYMLMAACGAGADMDISYRANSALPGCVGTFRVFCDKLAASVAMSFFAFVCIALSTAMAYFRTYKVATG